LGFFGPATTVRYWLSWQRTLNVTESVTETQRAPLHRADERQLRPSGNGG